MATFRMITTVEVLENEQQPGYSLESMLSANTDDADFCEWARSAQIGHKYVGYPGDDVIRIA